MQSHLATVRNLSQLLDNRFSFLGFRFGLDPIIGMIPWVGDLVGLGLSLYIVWIAKNLGAPQSLIARMGVNIFIDFFLGIIPFVGDFADFIFRANRKNLSLLENFIVAQGLDKSHTS